MLKIINPATENKITELKEDSAAIIQEKFLRAKQVQKKWAQTPLKYKIRCIQNFKKLLIKKKEKLALILTQEMGKPITQSYNELTGTLSRLDFFLKNTANVIKEKIVFKDSTLEEKLTLEPLGVIANISAWNYPYFIGTNVFIPALLTGNTVLYKPSEFATLTGLAIAHLLYESGIPKDVFIPIVGGGTVGSHLLNQPLNGVFFTGSYVTGTKISKQVLKQMMKVQLELGGKDPIYICNDIKNISSVAAAVADGAFYNTGQSCCSVERIYVHKQIYNSFVKAFMKEIRGFRIGDPMDEKTYIGPITREAHLRVLQNHVSDAISKGAKIICGGKRIKQKGFYFEPTVVLNVNHSMLLMREETFGPLIGIQKVANDQEAITLMNDTPYGLTAGVYSKNKTRAEKILAQANTGSVYWNCCDRVSPRLPWSGRGHSGIGSTLSVLGIQTFLQPKAWHCRSG